MSPATITRTPRSAIDRIDALCSGGLESSALLEEVTEVIASVIPHEAMFIAATDPETMLGLGAGFVRKMPEEMCEPFWAYEFEVPDFAKFTDLLREDRPVADLHTVTGGRPERSARWREFSRHRHLRAEVRSVFKAGGRGWGIVQLNREETDGGGFTVAEQDFLHQIGPIVARALRQQALRRVTDGSSCTSPGMAIIDEHNHLRSATPEAIEWLDRLQSYRRRERAELGVQVPWEVVHASQVARARVLAGSTTPTRTRVRTRCGRWVLIHASCLAAVDGTAGHTAIVIEPATASEMAPLIVEAYGITPRELDVTNALARGLSISDIAGQLHLSRYTVQDHLKRIYEKVGVASRAELVATMFADHYQPRMDVVHAAAA